MNLAEIQQAVRDGKIVHWSNTNYSVIVDKIGQWLIKCTSGHCIGLTWQDGVTLNGKESQFYVPKSN
jgi:hypothetical protein